MAKKKLDPILMVFAVITLFGGVWGVIHGSIYIPHRHGGSTYEAPGGYFISGSLLVVSLLLYLGSRKIKLKKLWWVAAIAIAVLLFLAGFILGPTVRY